MKWNYESVRQNYPNWNVFDVVAVDVMESHELQYGTKVDIVMVVVVVLL